MTRRAASVVSAIFQSAGFALLVLNVLFISSKIARAQSAAGDCQQTVTVCKVNTCTIPANCTSVNNCIC